MKLSRHNGRTNKNGAYKVSHNDRKFDVDIADHIDKEKYKANIYWDCYQGYYSEELLPREDGEIPAPFLDVERLYYHEHYSNFCEKQSERNHAARHFNRDRTPEDLRQDKRTCPEESILQIGNMDESVSPDVLAEIATEYFEEFNRRFGEHVHILNWALHLDEATPHIHERHVFDCENKYGEVTPQQEKALEALSIDPPDPDKKINRTNNRKITFDKICRTLLLDISKKHGLSLDEEPEFGGREYLEKQDFILQKQKEKIASQEHRLEELEITISDTEKFVERIADTAYEKAKDVITEKVVEETRNMDFAVIEDFKNEFLAPENKAGTEARKVGGRLLDMLMSRFQGFTERISHRLGQILSNPKVKEQSKEPIKQSILAELKQAKAEQAEQERNHPKAIHKNKQRGSELE